MNEREPRERRQTERQAIFEALGDEPVTARQLSEQVGLSERDITGHLEHLVRSARTRGAVVIEPPMCRACGFRFDKRSRLSTPSRCPACKSERVAQARFSRR